jgi:hypothetical protein
MHDDQTYGAARHVRNVEHKKEALVSNETNSVNANFSTLRFALQKARLGTMLPNRWMKPGSLIRAIHLTAHFVARPQANPAQEASFARLIVSALLLPLPPTSNVLPKLPQQKNKLANPSFKTSNHTIPNERV